MMNNILKGLLLGIPLAFIMMFTIINFNRTPGVNDCMQTYVRLCKESNICHGTIHRFDTGEYHIEHSLGMELPLDTKVGEANGCFHSTNNIYAGVVNSAYCMFTYLIQ